MALKRILKMANRNIGSHWEGIEANSLNRERKFQSFIHRQDLDLCWRPRCSICPEVIERSTSTLAAGFQIPSAKSCRIFAITQEAPIVLTMTSSFQPFNFIQT